MTAIASSLIVGAFSLGGIAYQSNKNRALTELAMKRDINEVKASVEKVDKKVDKLDEKVEKHNNFGLRINSLEKEVELRKGFCDDKWDRFEAEIRGGDR